MTINHVLAVVAVTDIETSNAWYERLFGRPADNTPMPGQLVEWRVTENGWLQVTRDPQRAGQGLVNFAVDDLSRHVAEIADRGLVAGPIETVTKGVQLSGITDPDGNAITFLGQFRIHY